MAGHRERLRNRFLAVPSELSEAECLELLLTFAIPRRDVAPLAQELLDKFGNVDKVLAVPHRDLVKVKGIGEQVATLFRLVAFLREQQDEKQTPPILAELAMPEPAPTPQQDKQSASAKITPKPPKKQQTPGRTFTNDLAQAAFDYLPLAVNFQNVESYEQHLQNVLPYNSASSRKRYASNIINRYFADGDIRTPLTRFLGYEADKTSRQAVLFYETVKVESTLKVVAEKSIWPALPAGKIAREQLRNFLNGLFPTVSDATMKRMLYSIFNVYTILNKAQAEKDLLRFQINEGTLAGFLYILAAECPQPGIYEMNFLEAGPMRRWLLWDRDWMRRQLYNLQDLGILAKVNEIDTVRQFTLTYNQPEVLDRYYQNAQRTTIALREKQEILISK
ncbi:MAG: UPF0758 domain-containing protein [Caldilineaceae bacterium]